MVIIVFRQYKCTLNYSYYKMYRFRQKKADHEIKYNLKLYATSANNSCRLDPKGPNESR